MGGIFRRPRRPPRHLARAMRPLNGQQHANAGFIVVALANASSPAGRASWSVVRRGFTVSASRESRHGLPSIARDELQCARVGADLRGGSRIAGRHHEASLRSSLAAAVWGSVDQRSEKKRLLVERRSCAGGVPLHLALSSASRTLFSAPVMLTVTAMRDVSSIFARTADITQGLREPSRGAIARW